MGCNEPGNSRDQQQQQQQRDTRQQILSSSGLADLPVPLLVVLVLILMLADAAESALGRVAKEESPGVLDIRSSIVEALGLQRIPDPTKANVSQAEYERAHREYLTRLRRSAEGDARQRKLFTMYAAGEPTQDGVGLSFPLAVDRKESALVESATLRLMLEHEEDGPEELEVRLYRKRGRLLSRRIVREPDSLQRRWIEFELGDEVAATLGSRQPLRLVVQLLRLKTGERARGLRASSAALNVHAFYPRQSSALSRRRRSAHQEQLMSLHRGRRTECRGEAKKCCRHRMSVTFKDLEGFDFIIQPKSFDAGYCKGRCPPRYNPAHHHALLQSLIWKEDRKKAPRPCCAPSKLAELEILYFDENDATKLKVSNWKDMRVLECACS